MNDNMIMCVTIDGAPFSDVSRVFFVYENAVMRCKTVK